jgi:hypothetical protein
MLSDTTTKVDIQANGSSYFNGGSVGIGTTSPLSKLNVKGTQGNWRVDPDSVSGEIQILSTTVANDGFRNFRLRSNESIFETNGTERMRIDSSGKVGIGTDNPSAPLHVNGNGKFNNIEFGGYLSPYGDDTYINMLGSGRIQFRTNGSEAMRIDSSGTLLVGKANDTQANAGHVIFGSGAAYSTRNGFTWLHNRLSTDGEIIKLQKDSSTVGSIGAVTQSGATNIVLDSNSAVYFDTNARPKTDNTYDLGSGTYGWKDLYLSGTINLSTADNASNAQIFVSPSTDFAYFDHPSNGMIFRNTSGTERLRIDSSGNLLVGTTDTSAYNNSANSTADSGLVYENGHSLSVARYNAPVTYLNRTGSDGTVLEFRKSGSTVGSIGTNSSRLNIGSGDVGLLIAGDLDNITPWNSTTGASRDAAVDLGNSGVRFKDLYLSGIANVGTYLRFGGADNYYIHSDNANYLRFGTAGSERMRIDSSGNLLVGGTNYGDSNSCSIASDGNIVVARASGNGRTMVSFKNGGADVGLISTTNTATTYGTSSDARLKDITGSARGLEVINKLNPVAYNWKADGKADEGLIAQEVLDIVPNAVSGSEKEMYQMDYSKLVVHLVAGMKEQQTQIDALQSEINNLKGE